MTDGARQRGRAGEAGYTLIEALVMLAVTAITAGLVLSMVRGAAGLSVRIERAAREASGDYVDIAALRRSVEATLMDHRDAPGAFRGDAEGFSALTAEPLAAPAGRLAAYALSVENAGDAAALVFSTADGPRVVVREWPGAEARFDYLPPPREDPEALLQPGWTPPPRPDWAETFPAPEDLRFRHYAPAPELIRLTIASPAGTETHLFRPGARTPPPVRAEDVGGAVTP